MLYFSNEKFDFQDSRKINEWSTERGSDRAPREQMLASEFAFCCEQQKITNWLSLWCYSAAVSRWFVDAPKDNVDQMKYADGLAKRFSEVKDIRLMPGLDDDKKIVMELIWHQATVMLNRYAELKGIKKAEKVSEQIKPVPPVEKPIEVKKNVEKPVEKKEIPTNTGTTKKAIGAIALAIGYIADKLPVNAAIKSIIKAVSWTIGAIFK